MTFLVVAAGWAAAGPLAGQALALPDSIIREVPNYALLENIPLRTGIFDGTDGFGLTKIAVKHGIPTLDAVSFAFASKAVTAAVSGTGLTSYVQRIAVGSDGSVQVLEEVQLLGVVREDVVPFYYGQALPDGKAVGALTLYCLNYNGLCPFWVDGALDAGWDNGAYVRSRAPKTTDSTGPTPPRGSVLYYKAGYVRSKM